MKCPKCGNEIEDGKLYCENCGEEIKIVPDYDIELEDTLRESLSNVIQGVSEVETDQNDEPSDNGNEFDGAFERSKTKYSVIFGAILAVAVFLLFVYFKFRHSDNSSPDYQYNLALEYAEDGNYADLLEYLQNEIEQNPKDTDSKFLLAKYYVQNGDKEDAVTILKDILASDMGFSDRDEAFDTLLGIYEEQEDYNEMGEVLSNCEIERILTKYNKYAALLPTFNKEGGRYEQLISISLVGNTKGYVYYTLDGSQPTVDSDVYETPILLESGKYVIKAMFVNMFGVESEVATQEYFIDVAKPDAPEVTPISGSYDTPCVIEVGSSEGTKVYYTIDGTIPTKKSNAYTGKLEMPYGSSTFSFVAIDGDGVSSDVVTCNYELESGGNFAPDIAITVLKNGLYVTNAISSVDQYSYKVLTLYGENDDIYYIVEEDGTGKLYAINVNSAYIYSAYKRDVDQYNLVQIKSK